MGRECSRDGGREKCLHSLVGNLERKRPLGRSRCRWEDNTKMDLQEVGWYGMDWIDLAQDRDRWGDLVNLVINILVPQCGEFLV
jgi:hypothetical protein